MQISLAIEVKQCRQPGQGIPKNELFWSTQTNKPIASFIIPETRKNITEIYNSVTNCNKQLQFTLPNCWYLLQKVIIWYRGIIPLYKIYNLYPQNKSESGYKSLFTNPNQKSWDIILFPQTNQNRHIIHCSQTNQNQDVFPCSKTNHNRYIFPCSQKYQNPGHSQFRHVNHSEISKQSDHCWWNNHCNDAILSHTSTFVT